MYKASAQSPANIAYIKYWGKTDPKTRVPQNNSISMCLSELYSTSTVEFSDVYPQDTIEFINEKIVKPKEIERIIAVLDRIRNLAGTNLKARLVTQNNFPKATGIASSASGLSAVTIAALAALDIQVSQIELSKLARLASGTAARSIPDGFVEWEKGTNPDNSYARQLYPPDYWDICDVVAIVTYVMKKVSSTDGHAIADSSPFYTQRLQGMDQKIDDFKVAMQKKDFTAFGKIIEQEALNMHAICLTSNPAIMYWEAPTITMMREIQSWREQGELEAYFTIDAGPTIHAICQQKDAEELSKRLKAIHGVERISINKPAMGGKTIDTHLF